MGLLEMMVLGLCIGGYDCKYTPAAYYKYNKELQQQVLFIETESRNLLGNKGETFVTATISLVHLTSEAGLLIKLNQSWNLEINPSKEYIGVNYFF